MTLEAFLTHGLLSLVTNVVSDISLTTPQPTPHLSIPPGILVANPGQGSTEDVTSLTISKLPGLSLHRHCCALGELEQVCRDTARVTQGLIYC